MVTKVDSGVIVHDGGTIKDALDKSKPIADYAALRAYTGNATQVRITNSGIAGFFYYDAADTTSTDNGGIIIVASNGKRWKRIYDGTVNVKWFGAKGNGVDDDTVAFNAANTFLMTRSLNYTNQVVESQYVLLLIPEGIYKIAGNRIFGSQVATGQNGTAPPRIFQVRGEGATLVWDVQNETDELFYFDGTVANPKVSGLTIFTTHASSFPSGAGVIFRFYSNSALTNQVNASKLHVEDVTVWPGRRTNGGSSQRPLWIFYNTGNAMCDQMLIQHCRFFYMQKVWVGQNDQAVNITFNSCSMWGASNGTATNTIYFDFTRMNDNFNVVNCSFSIMSGETLIKATSPTSNGYLVEDMGYNFNFDNNRIELISGTSNTSWKLCDINFGRLNIRNSSFRLGAGALTIRTVVRVYERGNINLNNVQFNSVDFYFPICTSVSLGGGLPPYGGYLTNCLLPPGTAVSYNYTDGVSNYAMKDVLLSTTLYWRSVRFVDCSYVNRNGLQSWEFCNTNGGLAIIRRKTEVVTYSLAGVAFGQPFTLPPFQTIRKVTLNMAGSLPDTYDTFRVYIGARSLLNTYDVDNVRPDLRKNEFILFEGAAAIFYDDQALSTVEVALLNSGTESNAITSELTIEYGPVDVRALGITTNTDQIKMNRVVRSTGSGSTSQRPNIDLYISQLYFDTTLGKPIWWSGSVWKDASGVTV